MEREKFLTVMAVFDEETQRIMEKIQGMIISSGLIGTQTMHIPFHITLGSFPPECEEELISKISEVSSETKEIQISLNRLNSFGFRVLFAEPEKCEALAKLHEHFDCNYGNGFPWSPHATLFCGETDEVKKAWQIIQNQFSPIQARIVAIELGRFFPPEYVCRYELKE